MGAGVIGVSREGWSQNCKEDGKEGEGKGRPREGEDGKEGGGGET